MVDVQSGGWFIQQYNCCFLGQYYCNLCLLLLVVGKCVDVLQCQIVDFGCLYCFVYCFFIFFVLVGKQWLVWIVFVGYQFLYCDIVRGGGILCQQFDVVSNFFIGVLLDLCVVELDVVVGGCYQVIEGV